MLKSRGMTILQVYEDFIKGVVTDYMERGCPDGPVRQLHRNGAGDIDKLQSTIKNIGAKLFKKETSSMGDGYIYQFPKNSGWVELNQSSPNYVNLQFITTNWALADQLEDLVNSLIKVTPPKGSVYVLVKTCQGFSTVSLGQINTPLERENYDTEILSSFDHVQSCLFSADPCGRLVIFDGPPGTGKSYAIRALATEVAARFILIAPSLIGDLSGPDIIPVLLTDNGPTEEGEKKPTILIMEDADKALISRKTDGQMVPLSELLNIGDGLLGDMADLRIIATTNAGRSDFDKAVTRAGRMCKHINFGSLPGPQADQVYKRLVGKPGEFNQANYYTLADIYRKARGDGWFSIGSPKRAGNYL